MENFSLLLILFITEIAVVSPDIVSSSKYPKYFTLEFCLICISPYFLFSFMTFFILNLVAKIIDLVLPSPKWMNLLSTNQSQMLSKSLLSCFHSYLYVDRQGMYYQHKEKDYI